MDDRVARQVVAEWLEERQLPKPLERDLPPVDFEKMSRILTLVGPRRAGKTYFLYHLIRQLLRAGRSKTEILFVDFEDFRLAGMSSAGVDALLTAFNQLAGRYPTFLFFDEVQNLPNWSRVLRTLHSQERYRLVVTGSNSELLSREIVTALRGRSQDRLILPLSFREYLGFRGVSHTKLMLETPARGRLLGAFDAYLMEGGFPEVVRTDDLHGKRELLQDYYRTTFYRDILERYHIRARSLLNALMANSLESFATQFSISRFEGQMKAGDSPVSKRSIANYLNYLEEAFFVLLTERFSFSPRKRIMNPKKLYLLDTGFAGLAPSPSENRGRRLENVVAVEFHRRRQETFYHYKDGRECDLIVQAGSRPDLAVQVTWRLEAGNRDRELAGLLAAIESFTLKGGLILTYDQEDVIEHRGLRIPVAPVWKWLLGFAPEAPPE